MGEDDVRQRQFEIVGNPIHKQDVAFKQVRPHGTGRNRVPVRDCRTKNAEQQQEGDKAPIVTYPFFQALALPTNFRLHTNLVVVTVVAMHVTMRQLFGRGRTHSNNRPGEH